MKEIWKVIPSHPYYLVSSLGRVCARSRAVRFLNKNGKEFLRQKRERLISLNTQNGGYLVAHLHSDNVRTARTVHSLVAEVFIGERPSLEDVCHLNGNRKDNRAINLKYDTRSNNIQDSRFHGTYWRRLGGAKLSKSEVIKIRKLKGKISGAELSRRYGVHGDCICKIWRGDTWSHLK